MFKSSQHHSGCCKQTRVAAWTLTALLWVTTASADWPFENIQVHGFLNQGLFSTDENDIFGNSNDGFAVDYTQIGLNAAWIITPELRVAGQILSRRAGANDDGDLRLDYGLIDWKFVSSQSNRAGVRLGRIKMPIGLYNETRDVAHTHPGILLPQSIYTESQRDILLSADGVALYAEHTTPMGDWILDVLGGQLREDELNDIAGNAGTDADIDRTRALLARLMYEVDGGRIRLGGYAMQAEIEFGIDTGSFAPALVALTPSIDSTLRADIYGLFAQYNGPQWSLTGEVQRTTTKIFDVTEITGFGPLLPDQNLGYTDNWYLQLTYQVAPRWELLMRYDESSTHDTGTRLFNGSVIPDTSPSHTQYARDMTFGVRWDPTDRVMLRAELHHVEGTLWLPGADNPNASQTRENWNIFALEASYHF